MDLTRYQGFDHFYADAEGFLLEHEAEHKLILGITTGYIQDAVPGELPP